MLTSKQLYTNWKLIFLKNSDASGYFQISKPKGM